MTDRQFRSLAKYVIYVAAHIGLRDWTINILREPPDDDGHAATVSCVYGRKIANVRFSVDWMTQTPEEQRHVVIHELLHVHTDGALTLVEETLPTLLGMPAFKAFQEAYRRENEHAVDAIASVIEEFIPLWEG